MPPYGLASEIGFLSRRLLASCSIRTAPSLGIAQAIRQPLWLQPRAFSTSAKFLNDSPFSSKPENPAAANTAGPDALSQTPPPPPPPALTASAPSKKKFNTPWTYDATKDSFDIAKIVAMEHDEFLLKHLNAGQREPELRTRPPTGRTVHLYGNMDLPRALKALDATVRKNKIKRLWQRQKRHERPGLKRKRLKAERNVKRFNEGFKATVKRVQELTNQGW
ncbi:ribosomal protein s21 [Colletotrichum musicola]|uniref:Ribosomal protein s21 n=1 Tax=Colletotrichum musicola TaxID=2175873 RepID=A0A8H6KEH9_9PEZI|nr:ribosomal protein s21 [Colletotrichum musicola]